MLKTGTTNTQPEHGSPVKTPIILAKHEKPGVSSELRASSGRLWKPRGDTDVRLATSPKHSIPTLLQSGELPSTPQQPSYKIQQRNDVRPQPDSDWTHSTSQTSSVKIIDEYMNWCPDALSEFLLDQNDYRVIGVLGLEGVGKTYIMNLLATRPKSAVPPFKAERTGPDGAGHSTFGMNAYVTPERVILLDCQPLFSSAVLDHIHSNERKFNFNGDLSSGEDLCDAINMQLTMFMLSVCHIVIIAENWFTDPNLHRVLQAVEMLKPPQLSNEKSDEHPDFTSRIVFVQNMCKANDPDVYDTRLMEENLHSIYSSSNLRISRHKSNGKVKILSLALKNSEGSDIDRVICTKLEQKFLQDIMSMHVLPIVSKTTLTEKNWYQYACKLWDAVKKSPFISEYIRLLIM
ncbi:SMG9 [Bugula neritina]|uniref:SMG9 n=1 Tax=Bugula neritina TaxID=10212 RepID=A0A7J7JHW5_BUGNE|nr:SMG9 [Bugula neritina]